MSTFHTVVVVLPEPIWDATKIEDNSHTFSTEENIDHDATNDIIESSDNANCDELITHQYKKKTHWLKKVTWLIIVCAYSVIEPIWDYKELRSDFG